MWGKCDARRLLLAFVLTLGGLAEARAGEAPPTAMEVVERVNARSEGVAQRRRVKMELIDARGRTRTRVATVFRKYVGADKKTTVFFSEPAVIAGTAFLTWDYAAPDREDDVWLYLPAHRKVRRVSPGDRGSAFFGTDLSYEDVKKETKLAVEDYHWRLLGEEMVDGRHCWVLEAVPVDERTARELGYGRVVSRIDSELWLTRLADYWDTKGQHLKTARHLEIAPVDGIWTPLRTEVVNHRSGHRTVLSYSEIAYEDGIDDAVFEPANLTRGAP
ncbi:MAG TPA: outer membrane lipoprotein-sorting protein [Myxococcota bacterium]|jgi:hypothetical protein